MKKFKKIIFILSAVVISPLFFSANAERFDRTPELVEKIAVSVGKSGVVQGRPLKRKNKAKGRRDASRDVCENRLRLLREICEKEDDISDRMVSDIVGTYLRQARLNPNTLEGVRLHRSFNAEDLLHNVRVLINIYEDLEKDI